MPCVASPCPIICSYSWCPSTSARPSPVHALLPSLKSGCACVDTDLAAREAERAAAAEQRLADVQIDLKAQLDAALARAAKAEAALDEVNSRDMNAAAAAAPSTDHRVRAALKLQSAQRGNDERRRLSSVPALSTGGSTEQGGGMATPRSTGVVAPSPASAYGVAHSAAVTKLQAVQRGRSSRGVLRKEEGGACATPRSGNAAFVLPEVTVEQVRPRWSASRIRQAPVLTHVPVPTRARQVSAATTVQKISRGRKSRKAMGHLASNKDEEDFGELVVYGEPAGKWTRKSVVDVDSPSMKFDGPCEHIRASKHRPSYSMHLTM